MKYGFLVCLIFLSSFAFGQKEFKLKGVVLDEENVPVGFALVYEKNTQKTYTAAEDGFFQIKGYLGKPLDLEFRFLGFKTTIIKVLKKKTGTYLVTVHMVKDISSLPQLTIRENRKLNNFYYLNPEISMVLPNASGNFESYLKTYPGVSSNNELSSQYSVRGGNYDENLVYVNDFEIFRPFLVQQGQQEGLSFINPEMVSKIKFSTGGFGVSYGDKISSVLDITYKNPDSFHASAYLSLLGAGINAEIYNPKNKLGILLGFRERNNQFLFRTLDVQGNYRPGFTDFQVFLHFPIHKKWDFSFLGYWAHNRYQLIPTQRETTFGTNSQIFQLNVNFQGEENNQYTSGLGGIKLEYSPNKNTHLKWLASYYQSREFQSKDIQGDYLFTNLEVNPTLSGNQNAAILKGIGEYGEFADNSLKFNNFSLEHKGVSFFKTHKISWGLKMVNENAEKRISEYNYNDTLPLNYAGYVPKVQYLDSFNQDHLIKVYHYSIYGEDALDWGTRIHIEGGFRLSYSDYNQELLKSPRILVSFRPPLNEDLVFRLGWGYYYQSPILNEYFNYDGSLSPKRKSQKSIQYSLAADWKFSGLGTNLNLLSELYYKDLKNLIPYQINDVRIDYLGNKTSNGYAYGMDLRLSGQFVEGLESSFSLSIQKTQEKIVGYNYPIDTTLSKFPQPVGYLPRPTDQRFNMAVFFQDKLVGDPSSKVHLSLIYGSNLPIGPPDHEPYKDVFRAPAYRRVDIGFSKEFINIVPGPFSLKSGRLKSLIVYAEIFNLLNINNTISYFWIRDFTNSRYAVPNYLTSRVLNLKVLARF